MNKHSYIAFYDVKDIISIKCHNHIGNGGLIFCMVLQLFVEK